MKNHWIERNVEKKFVILYKAINQWDGVYAEICLKKFGYTINAVTVFAERKTGYRLDCADHLSSIGFNKVWNIRSRKRLGWAKNSLPRYKDPAFLPRIEAIIDKAVDIWKAQKEKEKQEEEKCETSSSS